MDVLNQTGLAFAPQRGKVRPPAPSVTLIVKGTYKLHPDAPPVLLDEQPTVTGDAFYNDDPEQGTRYESDFAPFKPRADVLVLGTCHAPGGRALPVCTVILRVGSLAKSLAVIGPRIWERGTLGSYMSEPEPFTQMSLRYDNSFGGEGYKRNPIGKGHRTAALPNVEDPRHLVKSRSDTPEPAGFGPLGRMWEQRLSRTGTYGKKWLSEGWPWTPEDFDWGHYNAAPADQIQGYLRGDEEICLENMHAKAPQYRWRLPGIRVRGFLTPPFGARYGFSEVEMRLDTLWVDMDQELMALVWRGVADLPAKEKFTDRRQFLIASEPVAEARRPADHYRNVLAAALAERERERRAFETEAPAEAAGSAASRFDEPLRKAFAAAGLKVPAAAAVAVPPEPARALPSLPSPPARAEIERRVAGKQGFAKEDLTGADFSRLDLGGIAFTDAILVEADFTGAKLAGAHLLGAVCSDAHFTDADLAGVNLRGADLTGAVLWRAKLRRADLAGAILARAYLRQADLTEVAAAGTVLAGAILTHANLQGAVLEGADLSGCDLREADLRRARLKGASLVKAWGPGAAFDEADLSETKLLQANLGGARFRKANGPESIWEKANLEGADFTLARLRQAKFFDAIMRRAKLVETDLAGADLSGANLSGAACAHCNFFQASLSGTDLTETDFSRSSLYQANVLDAVVEKTVFRDANLKMSSLA